ncbi:hypothetical protein INT45_008059 [Circinella minor]|uniref:Uncharacterized protein n=1 Tax=Circinella minor TaxID=1195481 RepID=A0A8H7SAU9_9FUNG|nr:hypothetical protein INT45_008059 [Circinella minor]
MSPHDHLSSFDASFIDSFSEDLIRQFDYKTEAIRNALNEEDVFSSPLPQSKQEQYNDRIATVKTLITDEAHGDTSIESTSSSRSSLKQILESSSKEKEPDEQKEQQKQEEEEQQEVVVPKNETSQAQQSNNLDIARAKVEKDQEEKQESKESKLDAAVPEQQRELRSSRSRFFRSPKKMKSLSRLFTTAKEQEQNQQHQRVQTSPEESSALPKISPWSAATPSSLTQNSSPSSTIFGNICQYPPKPLQYSTDISPPADNNGCNSAEEYALKSRHSCTLKPVIPEPPEPRRSSAPALPPRSNSKHHRIFAFFRSK